jgi:hypothetical protein
MDTVAGATGALVATDLPAPSRPAIRRGSRGCRRVPAYGARVRLSRDRRSKLAVGFRLRGAPGRETMLDVDYTISVVNGRALHVFVSPGGVPLHSGSIRPDTDHRHRVRPFRPMRRTKGRSWRVDVAARLVRQGEPQTSMQFSRALARERPPRASVPRQQWQALMHIVCLVAITGCLDTLNASRTDTPPVLLRSPTHSRPSTSAARFTSSSPAWRAPTHRSGSGAAAATGRHHSARMRAPRRSVPSRSTGRGPTRTGRRRRSAR